MVIGLNEKQLSYLKHVYAVRVKFLMGPTYFFAFVLFAIFSYQLAYINQGFKGIFTLPIIYKQAEFGFFFLLPCLVLLTIFSFYCLRHLWPLERDIKNKSGEQVDFQIVRKAYFSNTNECFFFFKEEEIPNIQIDHVTFLTYREGTFFYIYRAFYSKIVFENYMRFDLI